MTAERLFLHEAVPQMTALRNFALKLCKNEQYSKDLVQDTMLKACAAFHTYERGTNCRAWLFQICKNSFINDYRRKRLEPVPVDFQDDGAQSKWDAERDSTRLLNDHQEVDSHASVLGDEVAASLSALPPDYQTALVLCDIEGYSYEEIAEFMQAPIGTIRSRIHRGRRMLAGKLKDYAVNNGYLHERGN